VHFTIHRRKLVKIFTHLIGTKEYFNFIYSLLNFFSTT
jgi:hypothetical protein